MRILLQRVTNGRVSVDGEVVGEINTGLVLLVGFGEADRDNIDNVITSAVDKVINLRVFSNEQGKLDFSIVDIAGGVLVVPQFTLYGKSNKGRRPDFTNALTPDLASLAFDQFMSRLQARLPSNKVAKGIFGADMQVSLVNDGPLTLHLEF